MHDNFKNEFANDYKFNLIRIPYFLNKYIEKILSVILNNGVDAGKELIKTLEVQRLSLNSNEILQ